MSASSEAYQDAAVEIGKSIAIGAIPFVGQAIDVYDTLESAIRWYENHDNPGEALEDAKFDFILSVVGWIPGPGDGVKKSLRLVNKNPDRFAPVLFDLLREVLEICGIKTSPEQLLLEIFNSSRLQSEIAEIRKGVEDSEFFEELPKGAQDGIIFIFNLAQNHMGDLIAIVEGRLKKWKGKQPNSCAAVDPKGKCAENQPGAKEKTKGAKDDRAEQSKPNTATNNKVSKKDLKKKVSGVAGEHIADYICKESWGENWRRHDQGNSGKWIGGNPDERKIGKLSNKGKLFKLHGKPYGTGIDAVWRAHVKNDGKPYAIVEAKASPSTLTTNQRTLDDLAWYRGGEKVHILSDNSDMFINNKKEGKKSKVQPRVQMSIEWIDKNLLRAVGMRLSAAIKRDGYSRHLYYVPYPYLKDHLGAVEGKETNHRRHKAIRFDDLEIKAHVNHIKREIRETVDKELGVGVLNAVETLGDE